MKRAVGRNLFVIVAGAALIAAMAGAVVVLRDTPETVSDAADTWTVARELAPDQRGDASFGDSDESESLRGTRRARDRAQIAPPEQERRWPFGSRNPRYFAAQHEIPLLTPALSSATRYPHFLRTMHRIGGLPVRTAADDPERPLAEASTRFHWEPEPMADVLNEALAGAQSVVARQALIFHMAIALPPDVGFPMLRALANGQDPGDAEDAICALAFAGDRGAVAQFERLAAAPSEARVRRRIFWVSATTPIEKRGERDVLRSYRCIEVLGDRPYFHRHARSYNNQGAPFPWAHDATADDDTTRRLLTAWLRRYPGHCGSDNMAYRVALLHHASGRSVEALRWASRAAVEPDDDMQYAAVALMISLVALAPPGDPVAQHVIDPEFPDRNRELLLYLRTLRRARTRGYDAALGDLESIATAEPALHLSVAYRARWSAPVTRGVDSGETRLPAGDSLRRVAPRSPSEDIQRTTRWMSPSPPQALRTETITDAVEIASARLRNQFRAWETLAELERREANAPPDDALDLIYKQAAVHYFDAGVAYPACSLPMRSRGHLPLSRALDDDDHLDAAAQDYRRYIVSWKRAIGHFEEVLRRDPSYALADGALFTIGTCHVKAADSAIVRAIGHDERERHRRLAIETFEAMAWRYPDSPFAGQAAAAAVKWRLAWGRSRK